MAWVVAHDHPPLPLCDFGLAYGDGFADPDIVQGFFTVAETYRTMLVAPSRAKALLMARTRFCGTPLFTITP